MIYNLGDILYEGYGIDDFGRSGVFRTKNKDEILSYSKRAKNSTEIYCLKVEKVIPCEEFTQLTIFDL